MAFIPGQIGIAQMAWRIWLKSVVEQFADWVLAGVPEELYGGIPKRGLREFMEEIFACIDDAIGEVGDRKMAGCKIDLSKFFDTIPTEASTAILAKLGAPRQLVFLLRRTASEQIRWIDTEGNTHQHPIRAGREVIAGCPTSMLQTAATMACWVEAMRGTGARAERLSTTKPYGQAVRTP